MEVSQKPANGQPLCFCSSLFTWTLNKIYGCIIHSFTMTWRLSSSSFSKNKLLITHVVYIYTYTVYMKSLFAKTDNSVSLIFSFFKKSCFLLLWFILLVSHFFYYILPNQNNPTATTSLIEINWNAQWKNMILKIVKTQSSVFANKLFMYVHFVFNGR